jgi:putative DNA primase/helicase
VLDTLHAGAASCALTLLAAEKRHTAAKQYIKQPDGTYKKIDYDFGFRFKAQRFEIANLDALYEFLDDARSTGNVAVVRGDLDDAYYQALERDPAYRIARRKNDKGDGIPAHLKEVPRRWIMEDIDNYPLPPDADLAADPVGNIDAAICNVLPEEFHDARCIWQLSNSAGLVPGVLKAHLFFWLDTPWDNAALRRWIKLNAPHLDHAPFSANQPHYICDPIIKNENGSPATDPIPSRLGWRPGTHDVVALPPLVETQKARKARGTNATGRSATPGLHAGSIDECLAKLGDGPGLGGFHSVLLAAGMQYAIRCGKGGERDDVAYVVKLNAAIKAAPKREGRDVSSYLDDAYHARVIDGAFRLIENTYDKPAADSAVEFPPGFGMTRAGLYHTETDKEPQWICRPFTVAGVCENGVGSDWGLVLQWYDDAEHQHNWIVPRELFHGEPRVIAALLEKHGLRCAFGKTAHAALLRCLATMRSDRRLVAVERGGWHGLSYILPNGERIGSSNVMLRPEAARHDPSCATAGILQDWQHNIGRYCVGNSRLALFTSAAFAGPLLDIIAEPSGGLHLHGESQKGKSTAGFVAGSVGGKGARDGTVHQWRSTANGLEGIAARCSDGCLVLDEISQSEAKEAGEAIYQLANSQGKQRADRDGGARQRKTWNIIFLSSGELTLQQRMSEANRRSTAGMEIRLINIPSDGGKGMGLFENLHDVAEPGELADRLRTAAATYYGTPMRAFLAELVAIREADTEGVYHYVKTMRDNFIAANMPAGSDGQVRSVAGRFGLIAAAGEMAREFGILPWPEDEAIRACQRGFRDWLAQRGTVGSSEKHNAIRQVRAFLELHGSSRFAEIQTGESYNRSIHNQAGYRRFKEGAGIFMFSIEVWRTEVCKGLDADLVAKAIKEKDWLVHDTGRLTKQDRLPGQTQRTRFYVVKDTILGHIEDDGTEDTA